MTALRRLPSLLALSFFALQGVVGALMLAQPFAPLPSAWQSWVAPLDGVRVSPPTVQLGVRHVLDGTFQRAAETWVGDHLLQRPAIVRAYDQLQWRASGRVSIAVAVTAVGLALVANADAVGFTPCSYLRF